MEKIFNYSAILKIKNYVPIYIKFSYHLYSFKFILNFFLPQIVGYIYLYFMSVVVSIIALKLES